MPPLPQSTWSSSRAALRRLPRRQPARRHGTGAAAGTFPACARAGRPRSSPGPAPRPDGPASPRSWAGRDRRARPGGSTPRWCQPRWTDGDIRASRARRSMSIPALSDQPGLRRTGPRLEPLPVVVEAGDHHVSVLRTATNSRRSTASSRASRCAAELSSPANGALRCFFASRDGWITKFDLAETP